MAFLARETVDSVRALDITEVVNRYVQLNKGKALSPFTDEKTPSFHVVPRKGIWKCFSTGKGGDGISFVMEYSKVNFQEAVIEIARDHNIPVRFEKMSREEEQAYEEALKEKQALQAVLNYAAAWFQNNEVPESFLKKRGFKPEIFDKFRVGYSPDEWEALTKDALKAQFQPEMLEEAGLSKKTNTGNLIDVFKGRVVFPIMDWRGQVIAFTARREKDFSKKEEEKMKAENAYIPPKYINSPETTWKKGENLYGLYQAAKAIEKQKLVYLVEGTTDVIRFHEHGLENVVAPCGTALTEDQIKLIKKHTNTVCIVPDADQAGMKAMHRSAELLISQGMIVRVLLPDTGSDPDEHLKSCSGEQALNEWLSDTQDYLSDFMVKVSLEKSAMGAPEKTEAINELGRLLELIGDDILRKSYYDSIVQDWKDFKIYKLPKPTKDVDIPKDLNSGRQEELFEYEFWEQDNCYYTYEKNKTFRICPFKMEYLYYVHTNDIPVYVVRFTNAFGKVQIKALTADQLTVLGEFKKQVGRFYGRFIFEGSENHLNKINIKLRGGVKQAVEPKPMGYYSQRGFYIWANGIWANRKLNKPDRYGVVKMRYPIKRAEDFLLLPPETMVEIAGKDHFIESPSVSAEKIGEATLTKLIERQEVFNLEFYYLPYADTGGIRNDDRDFTDERRMVLVQNDEVDFARWASLIHAVYAENSYFIVAHAVMSLFWDVIYVANQYYVPQINFFGPPQQGKSTAARSIMRLWGATFGEEEGMNISTDTASGIMESVSKFQNTSIWMNEFTRALKKEREVKLEMLKSFSGGSGRKTRQTLAYNTRNEKNRNGTIISGQDSPSFDTGLNDRVVPMKFEGKNRNKEKFDELKDLEMKGYCTQVTIELLEYRSLMEDFYKSYRDDITLKLKQRLKLAIDNGDLAVMPDDRIILNIATYLAPLKILFEKAALYFPFKYEEVFEFGLNNIIYKAKVKTTTNEVAQFFSVIMYAGMQEGNEYKIQRETDGKIKLFLRLRAIMPLYRAACSRQQMVPFSENDIKEFLLSHRACENTPETPDRYKLGHRESKVDFPEAKLRNTSAIVMDYDVLRAEGIEFRTSEFVDELQAFDDESLKKTTKELAQAATKTHINGDKASHVCRFLIRPEHCDYTWDIEALRTKFNMEHEPAIDLPDFKSIIEALRNENPEMVDLKSNSLTIKAPF